MPVMSSKATTSEVIKLNSSHYDAQIRELFKTSNRDSASSKFISTTLNTSLLKPFEYFHKNGEMFVIFANDKLIAMMGISIISPRDNSAEIHHLTVHPDYRRQGLASKLLNCATKKYSSLEIKCNAANSTSLEFYLAQTHLEQYAVNTKKIFGVAFSIIHFRTKQVPKVHQPAESSSRKRPAAPMTLAFQRLKQLKDQTESNITTTNRSLKYYSDLSEVDVVTLVKERYIAKGNLPITILDSGCGKAVAMHELLETTSIKYISQIYGISKDYFKDIQNVLNKFPRHFKFLPGFVDEVLSTMKSTADIIFDIWGPYAYSLEKFKILELYYNTLVLGGIAYLYIGNVRDKKGNISEYPLLSIIDDPKEPPKYNELNQTLKKMFPLHFGKSNAKWLLVMRKVTPEFPLKGKFDYSYSSFGSTNPKVLDHDDARVGNALAYLDIKIRLHS